MNSVDSRPFYRRGGVLIGAGLLLAVLVYFMWPRTASDAPQPHRRGANSADRPESVATAAVRLGDIPIQLTGLGTVVPRNVVTVRSRVDGELVKVLFKEGEFVKSGALLAQIDARPYQVVLTQAQGALARDSALLKNAQLDAERYRTLLAQDSTSQQQVDTQSALVRQYQGTVEADRGQVDSANLSLTYARITAPISGKLGLRQVDPGNIVHASDTDGIAVITQMQPMTVVFAIPETRINSVVQKMAAGVSIPVEAWDRDNKIRLAQGHLSAADNQVDTTTGTVKLKAEFPNEDLSLFPNQFVNARALIETRSNVPVVPVAAVQTGSSGTFVFVVMADHTVKVRNVVTGAASDNLVWVEKGLASGEIVVVDGVDKLRDGSKIATPGDASARNAHGGKHRTRTS